MDVSRAPRFFLFYFRGVCIFFSKLRNSSKLHYAICIPHATAVTPDLHFKVVDRSRGINQEDKIGGFGCALFACTPCTRCTGCRSNCGCYGCCGGGGGGGAAVAEHRAQGPRQLVDPFAATASRWLESIARARILLVTAGGPPTLCKNKRHAQELHRDSCSASKPSHATAQLRSCRHIGVQTNVNRVGRWSLDTFTPKIYFLRTIYYTP